MEDQLHPTANNRYNYLSISESTLMHACYRDAKRFLGIRISRNFPNNLSLNNHALIISSNERFYLIWVGPSSIHSVMLINQSNCIAECPFKRKKYTNYSSLPRILPQSSALQWRQNERDDVSNHQPQGCLLNCSFRRRDHGGSRKNRSILTAKRNDTRHFCFVERSLLWKLSGMSYAIFIRSVPVW